MINGSQGQVQRNEMERNAYNLAFHELNFSWHWDSNTYDRLLRQSACPAERIHHYIETTQPHLLRAYDGDFLVTLIEGQKAAMSSGRG